MTGWHRTLAWSLALAAAVSGWTAEQQPLALGQAASRSGFRLVDAGHSGATFLNEITVASAAENQVLLNGSGVAAGDYDRDGLPDLYFCGLENDNVLYRNLGGFRFQPVSDDAVTCAGIPSTSAAFADLNGDGHPDLLISNGDNGELNNYPPKPYNGVRLHINDGKNNFGPAAFFYPQYGTYRAVARDFDGDGDLDIAAIAFFGRHDVSPQTGFVYLRQDEPLKFSAHTHPATFGGQRLRAIQSTTAAGLAECARVLLTDQVQGPLPQRQAHSCRYGKPPLQQSYR